MALFGFNSIVLCCVWCVDGMPLGHKPAGTMGEKDKEVIFSFHSLRETSSTAYLRHTIVNALCFLADVMMWLRPLICIQTRFQVFVLLSYRFLWREMFCIGSGKWGEAELVLLGSGTVFPSSQ